MTTQYRSRAMVLADIEAARTALLSAQAADLSTDLAVTVAEALELMADASTTGLPPVVDIDPAADPLQCLLDAKQHLRLALSGVDTLHEITCYGFIVVLLRTALDRAAR
jgi:hypothetical protein